MEHAADGCTCEGKQCYRCEQLKCIGKFSKNKRYKKDGLDTLCKSCKSQKDETNYQKHIGTYRNIRKKYYESHQEEFVIRSKNYRQSHPERLRKYYHQNKYKYLERKRQQSKLYREITREYHKKQSRERYQNHTEREKNRIKTYYKAHPEILQAVTKANQAKRRAVKLQVGGSYTAKQWLDLKAKYNFTCLCCGRQEPEIKLQADHVIPLAKGGSSNIDNIQPLCKSCNSHKSVKILDFRPRTP